MTLGLRIVLGIIIVPVLTAAAMLIVTHVALERTAEQINERNQRNREAVAASTKAWREAEAARNFTLVATWIDANIAGRFSLDATDNVLPPQTLFRSAVRFDAASVKTPLSSIAFEVSRGVKGFRPSERDREFALLALDKYAEAARFSNDGRLLRSDAALVTDGGLYYIAHLDPPHAINPDLPVSDEMLRKQREPQSVFRLELQAASVPPPLIPDIELTLDALNDRMVRLLVAGVVLMLLVLLYTVHRLVKRPLEQLVAASQRVAAGDFSKPVPVNNEGAEIARLVEAFNLMQREVQEYRRGLEQRIEQATEQIRDQERSLVVAQRLAATGTLAAGLAHEINNPLGGMMNVVRRLRKQDTDPKAQGYYDLLEEGLRRIETLMRQVLDFSRRRDSDPHNFDVGMAAKQAVALVAFKFEGNAKLELDIAKNLPPVFGDQAAIGQIVTNLLLNARDALRDGKGTVRLRVIPHSQAAAPSDTAAVRHRVGLFQPSGEGGSEAVNLSVSDDGVGMDAQTASRIFDPFFSTKDAGKGTGLGLSIVHTIVQNHGGEISVESTPWVGTTFTVILPATNQPSAADAPPAS